MYEGWTAVPCRLGGSDGDVSCIDAGGQGGHHALQSGRQSKRPGEHLRRLARGCMKHSGPNDARARMMVASLRRPRPPCVLCRRIEIMLPSTT